MWPKIVILLPNVGLLMIALKHDNNMVRSEEGQCAPDAEIRKVINRVKDREDD